MKDLDKIAPPNNLRELREEANLTQEELGRLTKRDIKGQTIGNIETRRNNPRTLTKRNIVEALSRALGRTVTVNEVFPPVKKVESAQEQEQNFSSAVA